MVELREEGNDVTWRAVQWWLLLKPLVRVRCSLAIGRKNRTLLQSIVQLNPDVAVVPQVPHFVDRAMVVQLAAYALITPLLIQKMLNNNILKEMLIHLDYVFQELLVHLLPVSLHLLLTEHREQFQGENVLYFF